MDLIAEAGDGLIAEGVEQADGCGSGWRVASMRGAARIARRCRCRYDSCALKEADIHRNCRARWQSAAAVR